MIACEVMFVEQRAGGSQGSSVWLVQLVLHRLCSNEQTLFHTFSLVGCQGCCKLSFIPSLSMMPTVEYVDDPGLCGTTLLSSTFACMAASIPGLLQLTGVFKSETRQLYIREAHCL